MSDGLVQISTRPLGENSPPFSLTICENCGGPNCCETDPPFLTEYDILNVEKKLGLRAQDFAVVGHGHHAATYRQMKVGPTGKCLFYTEATKRCAIYEHRPIDCRLFPLDIDIQNGRFVWIKYETCPVESPLNDVQTLEMARAAERMLLPLLQADLAAYAGISTQLYREKKWVQVVETGMEID